MTDLVTPEVVARQIPPQPPATGPDVPVTPEEAADLLKRSWRERFVAYFVKRSTGTLRRLEGALGVHEFATGAGLAYDPADYDLLGGVWDFEKSEYRSINLRALRAVEFRGVRYVTSE